MPLHVVVGTPTSQKCAAASTGQRRSRGDLARFGFHRQWRTFQDIDRLESGMKLRRLVILGFAVYARWERLSPQQKASAKSQVSRLTRPGKPANRSAR